MKIEKEKDSLSKIINDYIDYAFPLPIHSGPKNISFGDNKRMKDMVRTKSRTGVSESTILKDVLAFDVENYDDDLFYAGLLNRYINIITPSCDNSSAVQINLRDVYLNKALDIVSSGYSVKDAFMYLAGDKELSTTTVVVIDTSAKQYAKAV